MIISRTPLRISFFGGGTDYPVWFKRRPGAVLATTINKYIYVTCRYLPPYFDDSIRLSYSKLERVKKPDQIAHPSVRECLKFLKINANIEIHSDADLPARTGLGSSSSFTVGLLHCLYAYQGKLTAPQELAQTATHIEQNLIKENVGCQDQILAAFGGFNKIEFSPGQAPAVHPVPLAQSCLQEFESHLMLFFTGVSRNASTLVKEQLQNTPAKKNELETMFSMVTQAQQLLTAKAPSWRLFGLLLHENWKLKRSLSSRISNSSIDQAYNTALKCGAWGGKLLGAGGGGFLLIFAEPATQARVRRALVRLLYVPVKSEPLGSQIIFYQPNHAKTS